MLQGSGGAQSAAVDAWDEDIANATILHLRGEIDLASAPTFREKLLALVPRQRHIIADFSEVEYLGMSGVRVLEEIHALCAREGRKLVVAAAPSVIRRIFAIIELDRLIAVADTVEGALELLRGQGRRP